MKISLLQHSITKSACLAAAMAGLSSCVVTAPPTQVVAEGPGPGPDTEVVDDGPPVAVLPVGAEVTFIGGERVWVHHGVYYRRGPRGYVIYHPHHPHRGAVVVEERRYNVLPAGARIVVIHGERVWVHHGVYYRAHPHGGYVIFHP